MFDEFGDIGNAADLASALLFAAVFLAVLAVAKLVRFDDPLRRRLAGEAPRPTGRTRAYKELSLRSVRGGPRRPWALIDGWQAGKVDRARLVRSGIADPWAVRAFILARFGFAAGAPATAYGLAPGALSSLVSWQAAALLLALAVAGFATPGLWLTRRIKRRQRTIAESFPDALDMMVVCVEAGLGLDAALSRVGIQMAAAHPLLAAELERVTLELRAGKSREDALRNFAARVALPEVASFVTLLVQSEALGAGIAQTLRVHADDMRVHRLLRAEEMAHKLPVKLTVPLVVCILPAMLVAVLLPGMLSIAHHVLPNLGQ